jgi:hypothetical protein
MQEESCPDKLSRRCAGLLVVARLTRHVSPAPEARQAAREEIAGGPIFREGPAHRPRQWTYPSEPVYRMSCKPSLSASAIVNGLALAGSGTDHLRRGPGAWSPRTQIRRRRRQ